MIAPKKLRSSNIELYRIVVMLFIVMHHMVANSGVLDVMDVQPTATHSIVLYLVGMWGKTGINCFVLITGWFMCKSHITAHKFFKLLLWIMFYNLAIALIFRLTGYAAYSIKGIIAATMPVKSITYDFIGCYLLFYLFIPFLNKMIDNLNGKEHALLVILCLFTYSLLPTLHVRITFNYVTWFCILYLIASYLRLHPIPQQKNLKLWAWTTIFLVLLASVSVIALIYFNVHRGVDTSIVRIYQLVHDSNKLFAVLIAVSSFLMVINIKMQHSHIINTISASVFGVLLIHANSDWMRQWLWKDVCDMSGHYDSPNFYAYIITVPIAILAACILIDHVRLALLEKPTLRIADNIYLDVRAKVKQYYRELFQNEYK